MVRAFYFEEFALYLIFSGDPLKSPEWVGIDDRSCGGGDDKVSYSFLKDNFDDYWGNWIGEGTE